MYAPDHDKDLKYTTFKDVTEQELTKIISKLPKNVGGPIQNVTYEYLMF